MAKILIYSVVPIASYTSACMFSVKHWGLDFTSSRERSWGRWGPDPSHLRSLKYLYTEIACWASASHPMKLPPNIINSQYHLPTTGLVHARTQVLRMSASPGCQPLLGVLVITPRWSASIMIWAIDLYTLYHRYRSDAQPNATV